MEDTASRTAPSEDISLYLHIPFCETKCPYCDFNTYAQIENLMAPYNEALVREIDLWGKLLKRPNIGTIFFGGGTPSYLPPDNITTMLEAACSFFRVREDAEVTIEANPGDFNLEGLRQYLHSGVNRLSIGFQTLSNDLLKVLGRRHSAEQALEAYRLARNAGFSNVSIDLMFGLPHQEMEDWKSTLEGVLSLETNHLSLYCLTLEGDTPMESWVKSGKMPEPDEDLAADMYLLAEEMLDNAGFRHYEISNWAMPGFESRHNLTYWRNQPYLGVGPGAHSYLNGRRFYNLKSPREYIKRLRSIHDKSGLTTSELTEEVIRRVPVVQDVETLNPDIEVAETLMMGLRLDEGVSVERFKERFGVRIEEVYRTDIEDLTSLGLVTVESGALRLTPRGRLMGNEVFQRFVDRKSHDSPAYKVASPQT